MAEVIHPRHLPYNIPLHLPNYSSIPYQFHSQPPPQAINSKKKKKKKKSKNPLEVVASEEEEIKEKGPAPPPEKKKDGPIIVVLNVDMHCEGCAKKVRRSLKDFEGVEALATDVRNNKLTVVGKVDPLKLRERVERKTRRKVTLIPPLVSNGNNNAAKTKEKAKEEESENGKEKVLKNKTGGDKGKVKEKVLAVANAMDEEENEEDDYDYNDDESEEETVTLMQKGKVKEKGQKKVDVDEGKEKVEEMKKKHQSRDNVNKTKKDVVSTVVLKVGLHCEGCTRRIRKVISKVKGVESVAIDTSNELVAVRGTMDVKAMEFYLKEKLKRSFKVVSPKEGNNKKEKKASGSDNGEANNDDDDGCDNDDYDDVIKKEGTTVGKKGSGKNDGGGKRKGGGGGNKKKDGSDNKEFDTGKFVSGASKVEYYGGPPNPGGYHGGGYGAYAYHQMDTVHAPQMFSDENPNACSVM